MPKFESRLDEIARALPRAMDRTERRAAELVAATARLRVPVDDGELRDAIHVEDRGGDGIDVVAGNRDAYYGHFVEFGHRQEGGGHVPARPFLVPALEESRFAIEHIGRDEIRRVT